ELGGDVVEHATPVGDGLFGRVGGVGRVDHAAGSLEILPGGDVAFEAMGGEEAVEPAFGAGFFFRWLTPLAGAGGRALLAWLLLRSPERFERHAAQRRSGEA